MSQAVMAVGNSGRQVTAGRKLTAGNTGAVIKASAGDLYSINVGHAGAAVAYLKVYDKATAPAATDTPVLTIEIPSGGTTNWALGNLPLGFANGISVRASALEADNDTTAPAGNVTANLLYQ